MRHETARGFSRQLDPAEADRVWTDVVNDKTVKVRGKVYFHRLRELLAAQRGAE